jgi:phosphate-selective porin O/P
MRTYTYLSLAAALALPALAHADDAPPAPVDEPVVTAAPVIQNDVAPSLVVYSSGGSRLALGGLLQLHVAPWVGGDALLADHDVEQKAGFRLRRARLGVDATFQNDLRFLLVLNPLTSDPDVGTISEATVSYAFKPWLRVRAGADKVPFTHAELLSSAALPMIELPLSVQLFVPQRRLGLIVDGAFGGGAFAYLAGVMNATEGYDKGNQFAGLLYVARLQGQAALGGLGVAGGVGGFFEDGSATTVLAGSADLELGVGGASLAVEGLCDRTTPVDSPATSPNVADKVTRCGAWVEAGYRLARPDLQPIVRLEYVDDNTDVDDAGDAWLLVAGVNARIDPHLRLQLDYVGRHERKSAERANDAIVLDVQGEF